MKKPDWSTAPAGTRYFVKGDGYGTFRGYQVLTNAGTRFFWGEMEKKWIRGFVTDNDRELLRLIDDGLQPLEDKVEEPNWDTAPEGKIYDLRGFTDRLSWIDPTIHIVLPDGKRKYWHINHWEEGIIQGTKELNTLIENGKVKEMASAATRIEKGDIVSFTGVVISDNGLEVMLKNEGTGQKLWAYSNGLTIVKKADKPIPNHTVVVDSHGCEFILSDNNGNKHWIRISSREQGKFVGEVVGFTSFAGQALQKRAREAISV